MNVKNVMLKILYASLPSRRASIFRRLVDEAVEAEAKSSRNFGIVKNAQYSDMATRLKDKTVFILGSGSSIRHLDEAKLSIIQNNASIALNRWPIYHQFVANYYLVESTCSDIWKALSKTIGNPAFCGILTTQYLQRPSSASSQLLDSIPPDLVDATYSYVSAPVMGFAPSAYQSSVLGLLQNAAQSTVVVAGPRSSSLERVILLAASVGASEIVLCGIDLSGPFFWESESHLAPHASNSGRSFHNSISQRIYHLENILRQETKTSLSLAYPSGVLASQLPTFRWPEK